MLKTTDDFFVVKIRVKKSTKEKPGSVHFSMLRKKTVKGFRKEKDFLFSSAEDVGRHSLPNLFQCDWILPLSEIECLFIYDKDAYSTLLEFFKYRGRVTTVFGTSVGKDAKKHKVGEIIDVTVNYDGYRTVRKGKVVEVVNDFVWKVKID